MGLLHHLGSIPQVKMTSCIIPQAGHVKTNDTSLSLELVHWYTASTGLSLDGQTVTVPSSHEWRQLLDTEDIVEVSWSLTTYSLIVDEWNSTASTVQGVRHTNSTGVGDPSGIDVTTELLLHFISCALWVA